MMVKSELVTCFSFSKSARLCGYMTDKDTRKEREREREREKEIGRAKPDFSSYTFTLDPTFLSFGGYKRAECGR